MASEQNRELGSTHPDRDELAAMPPAERAAAEEANAAKRVRTRTFPESNYHAVFHNGKTLRFAIRDDEPIQELRFPEFLDIKITNTCPGGCAWCYQSSIRDDGHYAGIVAKAEDYFGRLSFNERPFQLAIGGGEPTLHPEFCDLLAWASSRGIMPNYTTNGMALTPAVLEATGRYCGGVALSCHPHLQEHWRAGVGKLLPLKEMNPHFKVNFHVIISDAESIDYFRSIYEEYHGTVDYFVLLPLIHQGRAQDSDKQIDYPYLEEVLADLKSRFGDVPTREVCDLTSEGIASLVGLFAPGMDRELGEAVSTLTLEGRPLGGDRVPLEEARRALAGALGLEGRSATVWTLAKHLSRPVPTGEPQLTDLAFGARFFDWLSTPAAQALVPVSIYEPEIMSKFLDMRNMRLYGSSFEPGAGGE